MRRVLVVGVGAGDPDHVTHQAAGALRAVDVVFVIEKGPQARDLVALREEICRRYIEHESYRIVPVEDPVRDRTAPGYVAAVDEWRRARAEVWERAIAAELGEDQTGAFLVWGDPAFYDSTIAVLDQVRARGEIEFEHEVVPGISSIQALAARHRVPLNRVGRPIVITTGRRIVQGLHEDADDIVVMLDADCAFQHVADDYDVYWGAYLGTPDEILVAGRVRDVSDEIVRVRREARERKGWIMDTYLLRRRDAE